MEKKKLRKEHKDINRKIDEFKNGKKLSADSVQLRKKIAKRKKYVKKRMKDIEELETNGFVN